MRFRRLVAIVAVLLLAVVVLPVPSAKAELVPPAPISTLTATPGPQPGEITVRWSAAGDNTDYFLLETATTPFSLGVPGSASRGRTPMTYLVSSLSRTFTLSAAQTAEAGAGLGTGNHLYFQLVAVNQDALDVKQSTFGRVQAVMPRGLPAVKAEGTPVRAATFNVRTARARADRRTWTQRASDVAREITSHELDVVALQELSPGRADGKKASTEGSRRQTSSLLSALRKVGGGEYELVRSTPYVKPGTSHGSQGTRILYDASRFQLVSDCPETTKKKRYNDSCTIVLPLLGEDSEKLRRRAAYAELQDRQTGRRFFVVSAHLDQRHSNNTADEVRYNELRGRQAAAIAEALPTINPDGRKVIFGGDINSWQTNRVGHAPHEALVADGFFDTASAARAANLQYGTSNRFAAVQPTSPYGFASRIDTVMVKGTTGANYFENVTDPASTSRPSDHNLVLADLVL